MTSESNTPLPVTVDSPSTSLSSKEEGEVLVRVDNVGKRFCRDLKRSLFYGMQDVANEFIGRDTSDATLRKDEFWANQGVSFELRRGECLGLIGRNGAGKTTLLKMLNGLIKPDSGQISMRGRVGALIALGAGFNPILTGRENLYIAGSVLGLMKQEITESYDEIVDFAELHQFMDTPVQSYSSGMQVRLGFAIATALKPDVLLLDEVLAVGDAAFRNKCYQKVGELLEDAAVILVTHNMAHIGRIASKVLVLKNGIPEFFGSTSDGIAVYNELNEADSAEQKADAMVSGAVAGAMVNFQNLILQKSEYLDLDVSVVTTAATDGCFFYAYFFDMSGAIVAQWVSNSDGSVIDLEHGDNTFRFRVGPINLRGGRYRISVIMKDDTGLRNLVWTDRAHVLQMKSHVYSEGPYQIPGTLESSS